MSWEMKTEDIPLGTTDKQSAQQRLAELIKEREGERSGRIPTKTAREVLQKPLGDLVEAFQADLDTKKRSTHYIRTTGNHVRRTIEGCRWTYITDVDAGSFLKFRATLRTRKGEPLSARAQNGWLEGLTAFFNWLVRTHKAIKENPLGDVDKASTKETKKIRRRALSFDEFDKLLQVAGPRRAVYHFAARTGLRRGEMKQVRLYDLHLEGPEAYVAVRGSTTKDGKDARRDLTPELVADLKAMISPDASPDDLVFRRIPEVPELCEDLKKAGILFLDDLGRRLDFHALRKTFNTHLAVSGVSLRERMAMMRHSNSKLTEIDYLDASQLGLREALAKLPAVTPAGTASQIDSHATGFHGQDATSGGTQADNSSESQAIGNQDDRQHAALSGSLGQRKRIGAPCRNRTYNLVIKRVASRKTPCNITPRHVTSTHCDQRNCVTKRRNVTIGYLKNYSVGWADLWADPSHRVSRQLRPAV
jgi:integrase